MKDLSLSLLTVAFTAISLCMLSSCDDSTTAVAVKHPAIKHVVVISPAEDIEPHNGVNKVYHSLIKDIDGDTVEIYQSMTGGVQTYNISQQHRINSGVVAK